MKQTCSIEVLCHRPGACRDFVFIPGYNGFVLIKNGGMRMLSYAIVGSGYRSEYYARIARTYPELFRAMYLCRSTEKAMECPGQEISSGSFPWE